MEDPLKRLGDYVHRVRSLKKLTLSEVRRRGGPAIGLLGGLESGSLASVPKLDTLRKIAMGLGVPEAEVFEAAGVSIQIGSTDSSKDIQRATLELLPGQGKDTRHPRTPEEDAVIDAALKAGVQVSSFFDPAFWELTPAVRRKTMRLVEMLTEELGDTGATGGQGA